MSDLVYKIDYHKDFGLKYPKLEVRKEQFATKVVSVINTISSEVKYFPKGGIHAKYYRPIDRILSKTELDQIRFDNSCDYIDIFTRNLDNFETFLFWFVELIHQAFKHAGTIPETCLEDIDKLLQMYNRFNFEYKIDIKSNKFTRIIDEATSKVINSNVEDIDKNESKENAYLYQGSVDDFLKLNKDNDSTFYYEALGRMKKVLERSLGQNSKKNGKSTWLSKTDTILDSIFKDNNKELKSQRESIEFIKQHIHHDKEDQEGIPSPYKFNRTEFIYWWLEMNNFVYLLNNQ